MVWGKKAPMPLQVELTRMAKLSAMESGLPILIRGAPVAALFAGQILARATDGRNRIEEKLFGGENVVMLGESQALGTGVRQDLQVPHRGGPSSHGAQALCMLCNNGRGMKKSRGPGDLHNMFAVSGGAGQIRPPLSLYGIGSDLGRSEEGLILREQFGVRQQGCK